MGLENGLPNTTIYNSHQDSQGFIWLTTQAGIVRYDGYEFKTYQIPPENGTYLSNLADYILEDHHGVIWVGYQDNHFIARYDSVKGDFDFLNLQKLVDFKGDIQHTRLVGIDSENNLWVSLLLRDNFENPILIKLNTENFSVHSFTDDEGNSSIEHGFVFPRFYAGNVNYNAFLAARDGSVWIGANDGLIHITPNNEITSYIKGNDGLGGEYIYHLLRVDNELWAATDSGLYVLEEETQQFHSVAASGPFDGKAVYYLYQDYSGAVWVTTNENTYKYKDGEFKGLNEVPDLDEWGAVSMLPQVETDEQIWFINQRYSIDSEGQSEGFTVYNKKEDSFTSYRSGFEEFGLKRGNGITSIMQDKSGSVWLGTMYSGFYQFPPLYKKFDVLFNTEKFRNLVGDFYYYYVAKSPEGHIFSAVSNGKVFVKNAFTGEESVFTEFEFLSEHATGQQNQISYIYFEKPGEVYIATEWSGLQRFTYDPKSLEIEKKEVWIPPQMNAGIVLNLVRDDEGNLWLGTTNGVVKADLEKEEYKVLDAYEADSYNPQNSFGSNIYKDSKGNIWYYESKYGGIKRVNPQTETAYLLNNSEDVPEESTIQTVNDIVEMDNGDILIVGGDYIYQLNEDSLQFEPFMDESLPNLVFIDKNEKGEIVVGTYGYGVFWINQDTKEIIRHISTEDGLANATINDIRIDESGNYWLLTALGLTKYNPDEDVLLNYYFDHGLPASESEINYKFFEDTSGTLYPIWISNEGFSSFNPNEIKSNSYSVAPVFTQITAGGESLSLSGKEISIPYNQSNINIQFSALEFDDPSKNEYRYVFDDGEWSTWSKSREIQLAQLSPGSYTVKVQARNSDMIPASKTASYYFKITPPWYQSTLAYWIFGLMGTGLVVASAFWYSNYRTEQKTIRMQAEQAEELAKLDQMKTNLLTNISHELRTPLTLVLGPVEQLRNKVSGLGEEWNHKLNVAHRNGKRLHQLVEQVLDLTRLDAKQLVLNPKRIDLNAFLKRTFESFESMAERNEIVMEVVTPESQIILEADPDKLEKIIVNLLSNAIKFTPKRGKVVLSFKEDEKSVQIGITDSGRGITKEQLPHIFDRFHSTSERISGGGKGLGVGLAITKEFVELHEGTIVVKSKKDTGTTFTLILPKKNYNIEAAENELVEPETSVVGEDEAEVSIKPLSLKNRTKKDQTILVVEDNDDMREYIVSLLEDENLSVETAVNGVEGQKKLSLITPDLIITDIMMPEMGGFEFAEYVRSSPQYKLIPVVMLSARAEVEDRLLGYEIGISDYLVKPFNEQELKIRIRNLLRLKQEREKILNDYEIEGEAPSEESAMVIKLQKFVEDNIGQADVSVEQLSEVVHLSRRQLYRKLKTLTGFTPAEFVREIRLYKARDFLEARKKQTVAEVSYAVGFSTPAYFTKLYKERFGRYPSEYLS